MGKGEVLNESGIVGYCNASIVGLEQPCWGPLGSTKMKPLIFPIVITNGEKYRNRLGTWFGEADYRE